MKELLKIELEEAKQLLATIKAIVKKDKRYNKGQATELESYSDYPKQYATTQREVWS